MELERTKGLTVYLAQPKNRRFAGLGKKCPIYKRTNGLAVNDCVSTPKLVVFCRFLPN